MHLDSTCREIDRHNVQIRCEFPTDGPYAYIQHNRFIWNDGREFKTTLPGVYKEGRLWWDLETFKGYAWQTEDDIIMLNLTRKDEPGTMFFEMIAIGQCGNHRARTWQWFKDSRLYKRTLCNEHRVSI